MKVHISDMHEQSTLAFEAQPNDHELSRFNTKEQEKRNSRRELQYGQYGTEAGQSTELCRPESPFSFKSMATAKR